MSKQSTDRWSKKTAMRLRGFRERVSRWRARARRAATLALVTAGIAAMPSLSHAQFGQTAMAPTGGIVNRAVAGFQGLNENGPGVLYYGINAADRGLGYLGSYMTLGGFVPFAEDDLGGFWAADLRGHLSEYGGFFSNVGAVRKQFIGGTLLGVGVYWDYDGDLNQYPNVVIPSKSGSYVFPGGQVYNQIGISGEWLTDFGNLRSNGYIPVGTTAQLAGPFVGNSLLCVNGINAALSGADLEVGAYIPSLADWAGMISVGGYALGNTRYQFADGQAAVPWFGGVYTRLDMTFIENWDFSLQANNDSYFDWTGFARLTYRMGGSRRRNVPDQVEQPMMRNEHIVRAHQAPVVATNPNNLDANGNPLAWQIIHVDNSATPGGDGTADAPFRTLAAAEASATAAYDVVYVHVGESYTKPYITPLNGFSFGANNQYLIGEGTSLRIPTVECGNRSLLATTSRNLYPQISNPVGTAIVVDQPNVTINHVQVRNASVGISDDGPGISPPPSATVTDVLITGSGGPFQRGVEIANSTGSFTFDDVRLSGLGNDGFVVSAAGGDVSITNSSLNDAAGTGILASGDKATVAVANTSLKLITGPAVAALGDDAAVALTNVTIEDTLGLGSATAVAAGARSQLTLTDTTIARTNGSALSAAGTDSEITLTGSTITDSAESAIVALGTNSKVSASESTISVTDDPAILILGDSSSVVLDKTSVSNVTGTGVLIDAPNAVFEMKNRSVLADVTANGIDLLDNTAIGYVLGNSTISNAGNDGIFSAGASLLLQESSILNAGAAGIRATDVVGPNVVAVQGGTIQGAVDGGILVENSDLRVEQLDPLDPNSRGSVIQNTGDFGIRVTANASGPPTNVFSVEVDRTSISGADIGIRIDAQAAAVPVPTIEFLAANNVISANAGAGILVEAIFSNLGGTFPGAPRSRVNASMVGNVVDGAGTADILLSTGGDAMTWPVPPNPGADTPAPQRPISIAAAEVLALQGLNNGAAVVVAPDTSQVNFAPIVIVPPPPAPIPPP